MKNTKNIDTGLYKVISIWDIHLHNPVTPYDLFVNREFIVPKDEFPEEFKKYKKLNGIGELISFFCQVFNYSVISISRESSYYLITLKKEQTKKVEFI